MGVGHFLPFSFTYTHYDNAFVLFTIPHAHDVILDSFQLSWSPAASTPMHRRRKQLDKTQTESILFFMANINEEFSAIQLSLISAQRDLERIDKPETPYEELHSFDEVLRSIQSKLKVLSSKIKADRSPNKQIWQRFSSQFCPYG